MLHAGGCQDHEDAHGYYAGYRAKATPTVNEYTFALILAEVIGQFLPVVGLFAGVSLAVAFIGNTRKQTSLQKAVVCLLAGASMALFCALATAGIYIARIAPVKVRIDQGMTPKTDDVIPDMLNLPDLIMIASISITCAFMGLMMVIVAMILTVFELGKQQGWLISAMVLVGLLVILACYRL